MSVHSLLRLSLGLVVSVAWAGVASAEPAPEFIRIPAGEFRQGVGRTLYGPTRREVDNDHPFSVKIKGNEPWNEQPSHTVRLTQDFELARSEVTVGEFRQFVEATGYVTDAEKHGTALGFEQEVEDPEDRSAHFDRFRYDEKFDWRNPGFPQEEDHPVVCVSWNDAVAYCQWRSKQDGETYRLPTEAEWEYACKAGTETWYSFGNDPDLAYEHANVADGALESKHPHTVDWQRPVRLGADEGDGFPYTAPVGSFKPNPWGLHDVHGNAWEWVADKYEELHYQARVKAATKAEGIDEEEVVIVDPKGPETTPSHEFGDWRVLRGGGWNVAPINGRSTMRAFGEAGDGFCYAGFRLARDVK